MTVLTRNLSLGIAGPDVADLQKQLTELGLTIPPAEQQTSKYGQGTHDAVAQFQGAHALPATGVIDAATAATVALAVAEATYTATGTVSSPTNPGVGGLNIQLVDKNVGADVALSATTTDALGAYTATAVISLPSLIQRRKTRPDLQVLVSAGKTFLAASSVAYNAPINVTLDVVLPANAALASEYETFTAAVTAAYAGPLAALQENAQRKDLTYLGNKIGLDVRAVALLALAAQFSQAAGGTGPAPTPLPPAPPTGAPPAGPVVAHPPATPAATPTAAAATIRPEFYYALFRAGLPANADALYRASPKAVQAIWQQATAQGVIASSLQGEIPAALATYQVLSAGHALAATSIVGVSTLKDMLAVSLPDANQQTQFAQLYVQHQNDNAGFWSAVASAFGADRASQLKLDGQLGYLMRDNAQLLAKLHDAERQAPLKSMTDLAGRGYYDAAKWQPLIGTSIPTQIPGATVDAQRAYYANLLAAQVRVAFPTAVIADLVHRSQLPIDGAADVATGVYTFLTSNQGKFEIGIESVEGYIARSKIGGTPAAVVAQIKRLQRVYQLTRDDTSMAALLKAKLDSAFAIARYDAAGFVQAFQNQVGGAEAARDIHARAKQIYGSVLNVITHYVAAQRAPVLGGAPQAPIVDARSSPATNPGYPIAAYPTLENLFGSMDYCECEECRSILGPAAYLVDLLHFLDCQVPPAGYQNPQAVLLARRPDLQYLLLTCANTNTALPYIDIVNETMEHFVANNLSLNGFTGFNTADSITSAELLAAPQNINDAAYTILQNSFFPLPLPFHRPLSLLRLQLKAIGLELHDVMEALRANDALDGGTPQGFGWRDILMEEVALSRQEYRVLTDSTLGLHGIYGYGSLADAAALTVLQNQSLQDFSRRVGVSYADLFAIVQTRFVNPNAALLPLVEQLHLPFSTLQKLQNGTLSESEFEGLLPPGIDARGYGAAQPTDLSAKGAWVKSNYARIMAIITFANPTDASDLCSATGLELRYANPDNAANLLHGADFLKLIRFIRLWRKLGLSIEQTDDIINALYPAADLPTGASDAGDFALLDNGFKALVPRIGFLLKALSLLGVTTDALPSLLACWAPIDTTGAASLYASMFLTPTLLRQDPAFGLDSSGNVLQDHSQTVSGHEAALCAAFNLTGAEFARIVAGLGFDATSVLSLDNISAVYRMAWLARTLELSVVELLALRTYSGLDPFAPLDPSNVAPAEPPAIRFIRLVQSMSAAGLEPVQALYLMWNQDINGKATPPDAMTTGLAQALRADFAAVESQFTLRDDPGGSIAKGLMALVYGSPSTDFFFGLLNNTLATSAPYASPQGTLAQPIIDASSGRLSYDDLRKQITFAGALDATTQSAIDTAITANGNDANLHAALLALAAASHQTVDPFFASYPELQALYAAYVASNDPIQTRRNALLASVVPGLKQRRKQQQGLASITSALGADPSFAPALLQDPSILHAASQPELAALADITAIELPGLAASYYLSNNTTAAPDISVDAVPSLDYGPGTSPLPAGQGGSVIAGVWSGYIEAPQDGFYNISIAADPGATASLQIGGAAVTLAAAGGIWTNQSPIQLTAGALAPITLTVSGLKSNLSVSWESVGLGWQAISGRYLYSATLLSRLRATYLRLLKATSLAGALSLSADEMAYLGTKPGLRISTADKRDKLAAGNSVFTPLSMTNIQAGSVLILDSGAAQEAITVSATTPTTFSAATTKAHDGTVTPFPIVSQSAPVIGRGWLNFLSAAGAPDTATCGQLRDVLTAMLDYARIKAALAPKDGRLLSLVQHPQAIGPDGSPALLALTGWSLDSLQDLLQQFFGDKQLDHLSSIENLRRVFDAYAVVTACRVSARSLIGATTNDPDAAAVDALQSALRARYAAQDWLGVVKPINDAMRQQQRDALVACILQQLGDKPPSTPPSPTDLSSINTLDKLFEYFLIDPGTEPAVETSRVRLHLSAAQIFAERCIRNLEPQVSPTSIDATRWTWMKRYRVWQANREIFLWPENWLYPELRDDQSPFFQQMMSDLQQSDITDDAAQTAYLSYLTSLESVAKLEPCGIYYVPGETGQANEISYVVGRTAGAHRKYYFRQLSNESWSPWTEMKIDAEDLPVTPVLWNGRLLVFWLKITKQTPVAPALVPSADPTPVGSMHLGDIQSEAGASGAVQTEVTVLATLCWSELYNGKWQPTKTSDLNRPTVVGSYAAGDNSFEADRSWLRLEPTELAGDMSGALLLNIESPFGNATGGFVLYNTHSLPIRLEDISPTLPLDSIFAAERFLDPVFPYTGGSIASIPVWYVLGTDRSFRIEYRGAFWPLRMPYQTNDILTPTLVPRYVVPQRGSSDGWDAPFFYEDRRNVFYVTTSESLISIWQFGGYGIGYSAPSMTGSTLRFPPVVQRQRPALPDIGVPIAFGTTPSGGDPYAIKQLAGTDANIHTALGSTIAVTYQGQTIGAKGSLAASQTPAERRA
jgi:peptidoglycan hydrolase-like protein with peptidoglycan-binding domain